MADTLHAVHGFVRYLVLIAGVAAAIAALLVWRSGRTDGIDRRLAAAFSGILDVQVLLGVALLTQIQFYGALMGHIMMMVLAAIVVHVGSVIARKRARARPAAPVRFIAIVAGLALMIGGIAAIGRSVI